MLLLYSVTFDHKQAINFPCLRGQARTEQDEIAYNTRGFTMLKYKRLRTATLTDGAETLATIIAGLKNKTYRIIGLTTDPLANLWIRLYRNGEQIVDVQSIACTTGQPILPMDVPVDVGDDIKVGFYNNGAATTAKDISISYEDK